MNYMLSENSRVDFIAHAPMHTFAGWTTKGLTGKLELDFESASLQCFEASANTLDFEAGAEDRTRAMRDYFHFNRHPLASFTMTECRKWQVLGNETYQLTPFGILEFAGQRRQLPLNCQLKNCEDRLELSLAFKWSFKAFGFKAPRLLFLTVRDIVDIHVHLEFIRK